MPTGHTQMVRNHPGAFVVVTGCYAQLKPETVSQIEGVDLVLGANEKANLIQFLSEAWGGVKNGRGAAQISYTEDKRH